MSANSVNAWTPSAPLPRRMLHVLMLPGFERADRIGRFWGSPESRGFAELLIECEETGCSGRCSSACFGGRGLNEASREPTVVA